MAAVRPFSGRKGASVRTPDEKTRCTQLEPGPKSCQPQRTHAAGGTPPPPAMQAAAGGRGRGGGMSGGRMHRIVRGSRLRARPDRRRQLSSQDTVGKTAHPVKKPRCPHRDARRRRARRAGRGWGDTPSYYTSAGQKTDTSRCFQQSACSGKRWCSGRALHPCCATVASDLGNARTERYSRTSTREARTPVRC